MSYEENVRAILRCCFAGYKDELIENAVRAIVALKQEPIVVNPISPIYPTYPYYTINSDGEIDITPYITCSGTVEDLKNSQNFDIMNKEN